MSDLLINCTKDNTLDFIRKVTNGCATFNRASWKYINKKKVELEFENSFIIYRLTKNKAYRLANLLEVQYFLYIDSDSNELEILKKDGTIVNRFNRDTGNTEEYVEYKIYYPIRNKICINRIDRSVEKEFRFYARSN